jgi:hypothetical protein
MPDQVRHDIFPEGPDFKLRHYPFSIYQIKLKKMGYLYTKLFEIQLIRL